MNDFTSRDFSRLAGGATKKGTGMKSSTKKRAPVHNRSVGAMPSAKGGKEVGHKMVSNCQAADKKTFPPPEFHKRQARKHGVTL